ncbi:MAG: hypothetical protein ACJAYY_001430 [Paraglaciecola sp.]|jgi:hypothetical protein|uniref:hypothetical protein n=1 Tax=Polaribacter sp. TaxID=1920175 RepID=UPI003ADA9446
MVLVKYYVEVLEQKEYEDKVDMITFLTFNNNNNNNVLKKAYHFEELLFTKPQQIDVQ